MRTPALPLQILLVLALILNGIGGAAAGVLAAAPALPALPAPAKAYVETASTAAPTDHCHEQAGDAPAFAELPAAHPSDCHSGGDTPCGDSAECLQACLHASAALPPLLLATSVDASLEAAVHPLASGHPAPLLRSPTRPPIA